jgi:hypothetical protein
MKEIKLDLVGGSLPAFPFVLPDGNSIEPGLTKRELFAALALQGMYVHLEWMNPRDMAQGALRYADALLAALKENQVHD